MKKYIAEALGTGTLTFVVGLSIAGTFPVPTPVLAALVLGLFVYSIGHISGCHINPAVTLGALSIKKIKLNDALYYFVAQVMGAGVAYLLLQNLVTMPELVISGSVLTGGAEFLGTFFFTFGIASVIYGKTPSALSGIVIGGSLLLGITISALLGANGILNPAVALGIGSFGLMYLVAPLLGSLAGMQAYKYLQ